MHKKNIFNYAVKDFLLDESFQQWVLNPDADTPSPWEAWQLEHTELYDTIAEAKAILLQMKANLEKEVEDDQQEVWDRLEKDIEKEESIKHSIFKKISTK